MSMRQPLCKLISRKHIQLACVARHASNKYKPEHSLRLFVEQFAFIRTFFFVQKSRKGNKISYTIISGWLYKIEFNKEKGIKIRKEKSLSGNRNLVNIFIHSRLATN